MLIIAIALIGMILAVVVFSTKEEMRIKEKKDDGKDPTARPGDAQTDIVVSPASEDEIVILEDGNQATRVRSEGIYDNSCRLSVQTGYGMTFFLGLEQSGVTDALYLNPHFEYDYAGNPNEAYGYLMRTDRVPLEYSETSALPAWNTEYSGKTDFAVIGRTYDKVVPAVAQDQEHYGVRWTDSPAYGGLENAGDTLRVLIIRLSDGTLMGAAHADILFDKAAKEYCLGNLINNDVKHTNKLTTVQREHLLPETIQYLINGNEQMTLGITEEELETQARSAVVESVTRTYYNRLYDADGNVVSSGKFSNCDIYAVNINCDGYGFFTVYFVPEPQANGLAARTLGENDELKLVLIGYDAFAPFTVESFNSYLHPDDVGLFAAADY